MTPAKHLIIIFGPAAVGKMTVGVELSRLTGIPLFHNHHSIELALQFFPWGHPSLWGISNGIRSLIFKEVASASDSPGMIFTFVWALDDPRDNEYIDALSASFAAGGARVCYVELAATLDERLRRNVMDSRLAAKPSKRNLESSRQNLLDNETRYTMNTSPDCAFPYPDRHLLIENTNLPAEVVARRIVERFELPVESEQTPGRPVSR